MRKALVNGVKSEAFKGAIGFCPDCGSQLIPKCGQAQKKINHWAHKGNRDCDSWAEGETEWHLSWKEKFPEEWREITQHDEHGEKHRADIKTGCEWIIEFQHSPLSPDERQAREDFYKKLIWVVDGLRLKKDFAELENIINRSRQIAYQPYGLLQVNNLEKCRLIEEWRNCRAPVLFDFGEQNGTKDYPLWLLFPKTNNGAFLMSVRPSAFISYALNMVMDEWANGTVFKIRDEINVLREAKHQKR